MLLLSAVASAWDVNDVDWVYQEARIEEGFALNVGSFADVAAPDEVEAVFLSAIDTWNAESDADLYVTFGGRSSETRQGGGDDDNNVTVYGSTNWGAGLAVATIGYSGARLNDCDIAVHARNLYGPIDWHVGEEPAPPGSFDLANTLTHELGHCLGMNHSDRPSAIMYGTNVAGTGDEARHLSDDDRAGIQFLYGAVLPELVADGARFLADPVHGEPVAVALTLRNTGDGTAWFVAGDLDGVPIEVGHLGAPTPVGARVGPDAIDLAATVVADCAADAAAFSATLGDRRGRTWDLSWSVRYGCDVPVDPPDATETPEAGGEPAGCGCRTGGAPSSWLAVAALIPGAATRRRRGDRRSPRRSPGRAAPDGPRAA